MFLVADFSNDSSVSLAYLFRHLEFAALNPAFILFPDQSLNGIMMVNTVCQNYFAEITCSSLSKGVFQKSPPYELDGFTITDLVNKSYGEIISTSGKPTATRVRSVRLLYLLFRRWRAGRERCT